MNQEEFEKIWHDDSEFVECFTSGSTGKPKEIRLSKEFMIKSAIRTNRFFEISSESRLHTCLDFIYIASKMMTVRADVAGCKLTSETPSSHPLGGVSKNEEIDLLSVVPAQMEWILDSADKWSGIKHILIGGSAIPPMLRRRIALSGYDAWETYGMTETASHIALRKVDEEDFPFAALEGISVEVNGEGCLVITLPDGEKLVTNDLAEMVDENRFRILGRADNCVISGGIKIIPEELERRLGPFIAFDYCLSSVPDKKWGEKLVIVVESEEGSLSTDLIKEAVGVRLRQYRKILDLGVKAPKDVVCIREFPRTSNGKIDRKNLKKLLHES
ncbi:MAG: AMP-binding protein [Muribaculaceae bacterium]|nr:AMP-binding protein [Muribaculaceae bacterium]